MEIAIGAVLLALVGGGIYVARRKRKAATATVPMPTPTPAPTPSPAPAPVSPPSPPPAVPSGPVVAKEGAWLNGQAANNGYLEPLKVSKGRSVLHLKVMSDPHPDPIEREKAAESVRLAGFALWLPAVVEAKIIVMEETITQSQHSDQAFRAQKWGSDHVRLMNDDDSWDILEGEVGVEPEPEQQGRVSCVYVLSWVSDKRSAVDIQLPFEVLSKPTNPKTTVFINWSVQTMHKRGTLGGMLPLRIS